MKLAEVVDALGFLDDDGVIHAQRPWRPESRAAVLDPAASDGEAELDYFLEVAIAREVVVVWSAWRGGRTPDRRQVFQAVVHYAERDCYIEDE